jgi:hypothetical protein
LPWYCPISLAMTDETSSGFNAIGSPLRGLVHLQRLQ